MRFKIKNDGFVPSFVCFLQLLKFIKFWGYQNNVAPFFETTCRMTLQLYGDYNVDYK